MTRRNEGRGRRPAGAGFTLLELLVVVAIMGVLAALTAGAVFQYKERQKQANTEALITKLNRLLQQQWRAAIDNAKDDKNRVGIPSGITTLCGSDQERALVIYIKWCLKRDFPTYYDEARNPGLSGGRNVYVKALQGAAGGGIGESSACLLLALTAQNRRGSGVSADVLTSNEVGDVGGVKMIVDGWGKPLLFYRCPTANAELNPSSTAASSRDTLDPTNRLMDPSWNNAANKDTVTQVEDVIGHRIHDDSSGTWVPISYNVTPVIASMGKDGKPGLKWPGDTDPNKNDDSYGSMIPNTTPNDANDNIYSYRLK